MSAWHVDATALDTYRRGRIDDALAFSLEAHLIACERCRTAVAAQTVTDDRERVWSGIASELDAPRGGIVERLLMRAGTPDHVARLLAATRSLRGSWLLAVSIALGFATTAAHSGRAGLLFFLILAPLLPVAGIAAAYGPGIDPTYEIGLASPTRSFRLLLIRSTAVLGTTTMLAGLAALFLPFNWTIAAWLMPSLALTLASLALATILSPIVAASLVAGSWIAVTVLVAAGARDELVAFRGVGQSACALLALAGALVLASRRDTFDGRRSR